MILATSFGACTNAACAHETFRHFTCQEVIDAARTDVGLSGVPVEVIDVPARAPIRTAADVALVVETDRAGQRPFILVGKRSIDPELHAWIVDEAAYAP